MCIFGRLCVWFLISQTNLEGNKEGALKLKCKALQCDEDDEGFTVHASSVVMSKQIILYKKKDWMFSTDWRYLINRKLFDVKMSLLWSEGTLHFCCFCFYCRMSKANVSLQRPDEAAFPPGGCRAFPCLSAHTTPRTPASAWHGNNWSSFGFIGCFLNIWSASVSCRKHTPLKKKN